MANPMKSVVKPVPQSAELEVSLEGARRASEDAACSAARGGRDRPTSAILRQRSRAYMRGSPVRTRVRCTKFEATTRG
jgi:transposase